MSRQGYMTRRAVERCCRSPSARLGLHRLEAACLPHNAPPMRVLEKAGFRREGLARRYLKINGTWQDHVCIALLQDDRAR